MERKLQIKCQNVNDRMLDSLSISLLVQMTENLTSNWACKSMVGDV